MLIGSDNQRVNLLFVLVAFTAACTCSDSPTSPDVADSPPVTPVDSGDSASASTDTDTAPIPIGATLHQSGQIHCANPAARNEQPYDRLQPTGALQDEAFDPASTSLFVGGGITVADFTGDGLLDLVLVSRETLEYYVQGPKLTFENWTSTLPVVPERSTGASPADADGDGDLDLFIANFLGPDLFFLNDGTGHFSDHTALAGLAGPADGRSIIASWSDYDLDGDLDIFLAVYGALGSPLPYGDPSYLYVNIGDAQFADRRDLLDETVSDAHTFIGSWVDIDHDRIPELYVVNDFGWTHPNPMLRVTKDGLRQDHLIQGLEIALESMGLAVGDINDDEIPDFAVAAWDDIALLESESNDTWFDVADVAGVTTDPSIGRDVAWGAEFGDVDNDGDQDLMVVFGFLRVDVDNPQDQPDALFLRNEKGTYDEVAEAWGIADVGRSRGFVFVDLDNNGWLDIIKRDLRGPTHIDLARCGAASWTRVTLQSDGPNTYGIGARVKVVAGERSWVRWVRAGGTGYASAGPPEVHFGLGDAMVIDQLMVEWPDGRDDEFHDIAANQILMIERTDVP